MIDDEKKRKLKEVVNHLNITNNKIGLLNTSINNLKSQISKNILINDQIYKEDSINEIISSVATVRDSINGVVNGLEKTINS